MPSTTLLANKLALEYPAFQFQPDETFRWSPPLRTIFYKESDDAASLLHELAHALLGHSTYVKDIGLIEMERDAWEHTRTLALKYAVEIPEDTIEDALDTYREWLHARSKCPNCNATGVQTRKNAYKCLACETLWRVNDARICALRRYITKQNTPR